MKKLFTTLAAVLCIQASIQAQWTPKAPISAARDAAASWVINGKFYVVGGNGRSDLREYNPATNHWTIKAAIPQGPTGFAFAFVINGKGYLCGGVGMSGNYYGSLNEYDPATNQWTSKAPLPNNITRGGGFSFAIGNKGYIGCGDDGSFMFPDVYEYDATTDSWSLKSQFSGAVRSFPYCFSIGDTAYVGGGETYSSVEKNDLWKYDQANDDWIQCADLPGAPRQAAVSFGSLTKGYVGLGQTDYTSAFDDMYAYDPVADAWDTVRTFSPGPRAWPVGFAQGDSIYVCSGWNFSLFYGDLYALSLGTGTVSTVGIRSQEAPVDLVIYPNPAGEEVSVLLPGVSQQAVVEIYTVLGELIRSEAVCGQRHQLKIQALPRGIYSLSVKDERGHIATSRLVKE